MEQADWIVTALALLLGYVAGSIPFGVILTRAAGAGDIRTIGSGNIGATNVLRTGRKGLAAATLILDALKGVAAVLIAAAIWPAPDAAWPSAVALCAAAGAFVGHLYPVWIGFRGGKGVATYLGLALVIHWPCGVVFAVIWLLAALATRYSSVGGMAASIAAPVSMALYGHFNTALLFLGLTLLLLWKHRANLERLMDGTESRIGSKSGSLG